MSQQISADDLKSIIQDRLDVFYNRRINKLSGLDLWETLKSKNPYLFRAVGIQKASEFVEELLKAYMSSSDEGIFGAAFFEPVALAVAKGSQATQVGMDAVIETDSTYTVLQIKSGPNWGNADQQRKLRQNFEDARTEFLAKNIQKEFRALLGQCYGRTKGEPNDKRIHSIRSGQAFWEEITGDSDFYLKLLNLMEDYPIRHRPDFQKEWSKAVNRFTKEFLEHFDNDGEIDWDKIAKLNSGKIPPKKPKTKKKSESTTEQGKLLL